MQGSLNVQISEAELEQRKSVATSPRNRHLRGWPALYQAHVLQPEEGCDFDFLRARTEEERLFVPPIVGRS
jgi:dihydroxy-acid dehydratase